MGLQNTNKLIEEYKKLQNLETGFFEWIKYTKILHPTKGFITPIVYDKFREAIEALINKHYVIILKSRQVGVSTLFSLFSLWAATLMAGWSAGIVSRRREDAANFLEKGRVTLKYLPPHIVPKVSYWNRMSIGFGHNSKIVTSPPTKDAFRGETLSLLIIDEVASCWAAKDLYAAALLTLSQSFKTQENRRRVPYGIVLISTGAELVSTQAQWFFDMWNNAESRVNSFYPVKIHWSDAGYDESWKLEQDRALEYDKDKILTELECGFVLARRETLLFDPEALGDIQKNVARARRIPYSKWGGKSK